MACKLIDGKLVAYQLGQVKGAERVALETHLKDCHDCLASFFIAKNAWDDSRESEDKPSPAVGEAIMAAFHRDVRGCTGGLFESAVATTGLLLPVGAKVTLVKYRGGSEETLTAKGGPILEGLPKSVVVDGDTSSGCELLAGALQQDLNATLVGSTTFGKWSIQSVDELENHYAMKFTVATYYPPNGADLSGKG